MAIAQLKAGDTTPELAIDLSDEIEDEGDFDFDTDDTVRFYMQEEPDDTGAGDLVVNEEIPSSQINYSKPAITYDFQSGDTSIVSTHNAEVVITFADGEVRSFPGDQRYYKIEINDPLDRDIPPADLKPENATVTILTAGEVALADTGVAPDAAGEMRNDAGDIKAHSGGAVRNLSNIGAEFDLDVRTVTGDTTAADNELVLVDTSNAAVTVTLDAPAAGMGAGVKVIDATNATTVATPNAETIDGRSELTITDQYVSRSITSDGNNYFIR